jgi:hypothetical protein
LALRGLHGRRGLKRRWRWGRIAHISPPYIGVAGDAIAIDAGKIAVNFADEHARA